MTPTQISEILFKVVSDEKLALQRGLKDRERISAIIARGEEPYGHRVDWLRDTAHALNETLMVQAKKFNTAYPGDKISVQDLIDALETIQQFIVRHCKDSSNSPSKCHSSRLQ